jgi:hypothetical protein
MINLCYIEDAINAGFEVAKEIEVYNIKRSNCGYDPIRIGLGANTGI